MPIVVFIAGYHNTGKTTLTEKLSKELTLRGYRVGYIKHDPKGHGITDKEGSDSYRLFQILDRVALLGAGKLTLWEKTEDDPLKAVERYFSDFDVVLLEGWKSIKGFKKLVLGDLDVEGFRIDEKVSLEEIINYILT
ncbi:molybdopterin-guanine dinucleotide biosynthesis protein B [Hydrogenobacter hydrogenophilus]|uniref:Molybdopterin-guanine dinucleotide biosynthesis protein B n=1 Tax=Hydrogenobacter hydrogenophilus TaxID=35835 RepID=A0A285NST7_9AQUI|nr:molybdopterin-guanine dinucleotide biosynthesis protein B [Hydrogenobacter hydrogenophilus]SNZ12003.1 molybdopterin-guanine dinucleotide biosynthesis protein B [Hydrogenobacter hydrogenophilus]